MSDATRPWLSVHNQMVGPALTVDEANEYAGLAAGGDSEACATLVRSIYALILAQAGTFCRRMQRQGMYECLVGTGVEAVMEAVYSWRPGAGKGFKAYALQRVTWAMMRHIADMSYVVAIPRDVLTAANHLRAGRVPRGSRAIRDGAEGIVDRRYASVEAVNVEDEDGGGHVPSYTVDMSALVDPVLLCHAVGGTEGVALAHALGVYETAAAGPSEVAHRMGLTRQTATPHLRRGIHRATEIAAGRHCPEPVARWA